MSGEQEKVELEQVPLKTDTDEKPAEGTEEKKTAPKKTWFFNKPKKTVATTEESAEKPAEEEKKKKCFWQRCSNKTAAEGDKQEMSIGIDMQLRDEKSLNEHVKLTFEDVFGEPDSFHSWDCTWRIVYRVFEFTRLFFYRLFSCLIGTPVAIILGVLFAFIVTLNVYVVVPTAKLAAIPLTWLALAWAWIVRNVADPVTRSLGLLFSSVHVRKYGINQDPTTLA